VFTLRTLTENWKLKLLALALAVLLWVVVSADQVTSNWIPVPLRIQVADPAYRLIESSAPREVEVRFTGPGRDFLDLAIRRSPLTLSIADVSDTSQAYRLEPGMVQVPNQLSVNPQDVRPATVALRFLRLEDRLVPVSVPVRNELGTGWMLVDSLTVEPARVRVRGPLHLVGEVNSLRTEAITISPGDGAFSRIVPIDTQYIAGVELSSRWVRVSGEVDRVHQATHLAVPISIGVGVSVRPGVVDVTLRGPEQVVRGMSRDDVRAVVAIDSIPDQIPVGGVGVPVRIEGLAPGVVAEPNPRSVRLFPVQGAPVGSPAPTPAATDTLSSPDAG
jgi:hypothetical protein